MKRQAAIISLAILVLGTDAVVDASLASPQSDLMAVDRAFSKLSVAGGRDYAVLAYAANDAQLLGNGSEPPANGRAQAFRRLLRGRESGTLSWEPEASGVSADGRMGWTDGHWLLTGKGGKRSSAGHYLTVWIKDRKGAWKVQADMGTTDPAPKK